MQYRRFCDYVDENGDNIVQLWLGGVTTKQRAHVQVQLRYMQDEAVPSVEKLKILNDERDPEAAGLWELRFTFNRIQHRPLLYKGPGVKDMTILFEAYEQGDRWVPRGALGIAQRIREVVEANPTRSIPHDWR